MEEHSTPTELDDTTSDEQDTYISPVLTPLGTWQALTLVVSVPMGPGSNWTEWH